MLTLHTFAISHFSEKIRWTLRVCAVPFVERPLTPGLHAAVTPFIGRRGSSVPIVTGDGLRVQGSDRILSRLATRGLIDSLLPDEDDARDEQLAAVARHDALGVAVMQTAYAPLLDDPAAVLRMWTLSAGAAETRLLKTVMPAMLTLFRRRFRMTPAMLARSRHTIETALDGIAERRGSSAYLDTAFGIEDLTLCALLAPLASPAEHPLYGHAVFRAVADTAAGAWRRHPTMVWVRDVYARQRPLEPAGSVLARAALRL